MSIWQSLFKKTKPPAVIDLDKLPKGSIVEINGSAYLVVYTPGFNPQITLGFLDKKGNVFHVGHFKNPTVKLIGSIKTDSIYVYLTEA